MSGPAELSIWTGVLLDVGLKSTLVLAAAGGARVVLSRASASTRHAVWMAGFAGLAGLPFWARARGPEIAVDAPWVLAIWALGAVVALLPLIRGMARLVGLGRGRLGRVHVETSDRVDAPLTWGFLRPIVLLPASFSQTDREAALAHELAHVRRADWLVHMAVWVLCAVFWFQPLAWLARRELCREAEHAADDAALERGIRPSAYAQLLLSVATRTPRAALGVAPSEVARRVDAVLCPDRVRGRRRWPVLLFAFFLGIAAIPSLSAWPVWTAEPEALTCNPGVLP